MHASAPHEPGGRAQRVLQHLRTPQRLRNGGVALGPVIAGFIYDHTESYDLAWIIFAVVAVVILVLTILAMNKSKGYSSMTEG